MLDYASLAALAAVVREGSFERAAVALHVTPSAVSQRIKLLEERLGCVLVVRGQPCAATDSGRLLCRHVEQVGMLEHDLQQALPKLTALAAGRTPVTLRVAVNADSLETWFVAALQTFLEREEARLDVALDDQEHTLQWLRSGEVLAAVTAHAQPVQGCNSVPLGKLSYVATASPASSSATSAKGSRRLRSPLLQHSLSTARIVCSSGGCAACAGGRSMHPPTGFPPRAPSSMRASPGSAGA